MKRRGTLMSIRRTAALALGSAILVGGGATALAATTDAPARPSFVAEALEASSNDAAAAPSTVDTPDAPSDPSTEVTAGEPQGTNPTAPSATAATTAATTAPGSDVDELAGLSDRIAGPSAPFGTMSTIPPEWYGFGDHEIDGPNDGPGLPFDINNIDLDAVISMARSVGIKVSDPVAAEDGSVTVTATLPNGSEHTVWVSFDENHHVDQATVDGTSIGEFVSRFLHGDFTTPHTTLPTIPPEWTLPD
jgi:hypothetical protein